MPPLSECISSIVDLEVPYETQSKLFRSIGRKNWNCVQQILMDAPHEARIWVVTKYHGGVLVTHQELNVTVWYRRLPLHHACSKSNVPLSILQSLLMAYKDALLLPDETGKLPLHHAIRCCHVFPEMLPILISEASASHADHEGKCPLHYACEYRLDLSSIRCLVEAAPKVLSHADQNGRLPLHWECSILPDRSDNLTVIKYLVKHYPEAVLVPDVDGRTPLQMINIPPVLQLLTKAQEQLSVGKDKE
jgi:ankyrin repeat protein